MKTTLQEMGTYTPLFDTLIEIPGKRYGVIGAAVFGYVWRMCHRKRGVCDASQETIAEYLGITRKTVNVYLKKLVEDEYIEDLSPGRTHSPKVYVDTGKLRLAVPLEVSSDNTDDVTEGVTLLHTNIADGVTVGVTRGVTESYTKSTRNTEKGIERKDATTTGFVTSQNSNPNFAQPRNSDDGTTEIYHSALDIKVFQALQSMGLNQPSWKGIKAAIQKWVGECEQMKSDGGAEWKLTNVDAILERYDLMMLSPATARTIEQEE